MKKIFYLVLLAALAACTSGDESTSDSSDNSVDPLLGLNLPTSPYNYSSQTDRKSVV